MRMRGRSTRAAGVPSTAHASPMNARITEAWALVPVLVRSICTHSAHRTASSSTGRTVGEGVMASSWCRRIQARYTAPGRTAYPCPRGLADHDASTAAIVSAHTIPSTRQPEPRASAARPHDGWRSHAAAAAYLPPPRLGVKSPFNDDDLPRTARAPEVAPDQSAAGEREKREGGWFWSRPLRPRLSTAPPIGARIPRIVLTPPGRWLGKSHRAEQHDHR